MKYWNSPGKYFYLYDKNGEKIIESRKEFSDQYKLLKIDKKNKIMKLDF